MHWFADVRVVEEIQNKGNGGLVERTVANILQEEWQQTVEVPLQTEALRAGIVVDDVGDPEEDVGLLVGQ